MWSLGPIGFSAPWLLLGLAGLPLLWLLLRAVPPAPIRRRFPGVVLLLGLRDEESQSDRTPWWLLLLRLLAVAAAIIGFAGPVLNPAPREGNTGPLLVLIDGGWAGARDWQARMTRLDALLQQAGRAGRPVAVVLGSDLPEGALPMQSAQAWRNRLPGLRPAPWPVDDAALSDWVQGLPRPLDTFWFPDGLAHDGHAEIYDALAGLGELRVYESTRPILALRPARFEAGEIHLEALRATPGPERVLSLVALGPDPNGVERILARVPATFAAGETAAQVTLALPPELRNRVTRFAIEGIPGAGAISLTDDSLKRREIALIAGREGREGLELLSPLHYLRQALQPTADLIEGDLQEVVLANPDVIVLADVATVSPAEQEALSDWITRGGLLMRFSGPRLAASDISRASEDPLMPVRLRAGGRSVGGAMSWGAPRSLRAFAETSPFFGLPIPDDVRVNSQVMAQPDPTLSERVIAALDDGTPLVTRKFSGQGQVVLFHVTANADWSNLPLSGLFVQMLERLAVSARLSVPGAEALKGTLWQAESVLDGFGVLQPAPNLPGLPGEALLEGRPGPERRPGIYAENDQRRAINVIDATTTLGPAVWPVGTYFDGSGGGRETALKGAFLFGVLVLLAADVLATLWLGGRLRRVSGAAVMLLAVALVPPAPARAQQEGDAAAIQATSEVVLAHVLTGDPRIDDIARAGLQGLSDKLFQRTSIEPATPVAVDLETDELAFFPFLYWPVSAQQPLPSAQAYARLNRFLRSGGMIMFDTRDADVARFGAGSPAGRRLQQIAAPLDIPPLEPVPGDHVLTRTFYLLQDFPGRHAGREVWVEAAPQDAETAEGMPFRNLNDGVTPVVIGGNDWAAAWAVDARGVQMFPVGRGFAGERQREIAYRFGINLIMHVLTGNYKSDQVHVPALLERLGQ